MMSSIELCTGRMGLRCWCTRVDETLCSPQVQRQMSAIRGCQRCAVLSYVLLKTIDYMPFSLSFCVSAANQLWCVTINSVRKKYHVRFVSHQAYFSEGIMTCRRWHTDVHHKITDGWIPCSYIRVLVMRIVKLSLLPLTLTHNRTFMLSAALASSHLNIWCGEKVSRTLSYCHSVSLCFCLTPFFKLLLALDHIVNSSPRF